MDYLHASRRFLESERALFEIEKQQGMPYIQAAEQRIRDEQEAQRRIALELENLGDCLRGVGHFFG